jgi:hypothetical protein
MNHKVAALEIDQAARTAEIVQQVTVNMEQIGIIAKTSDDMLVPDFGQQGSAVRLQPYVLPFAASDVPSVRHQTG